MFTPFRKLRTYAAMIANMNANNGKRLFAAIAIFAMLACVFAVAVPAVDAANEGAAVDNGPLSFEGDATYDSHKISNAGLGNSINAVYTANAEGSEYKGTYALTGFINKQDYNGTTGVNSSDAAQGFYAMNPAYIKQTAGWESKFGECYGLYVESTSQFSLGTSETKDTEWLWYMKSNNGSVVATVGEDKYLIDYSAVEFANETAAVEVLGLGNYTVDLPKGVTATVSGNTVTITGEALAAASDDDVETDDTFTGCFTDKADGYAFMQINGIVLSAETTIKQTNSALGIYEGSIINIPGTEIPEIQKNAAGEWVKSKPYDTSTTQYAFLVPKDNSTVTVEIGTEVLKFNFDVTSKAVAETANEANSLLETNDVVQYTPSANDVIEMPDVEGKTLEIGDLSTQTTFTIKYMATDAEAGADPVSTSVFNIKGTGITIGHGSIILNGETISGEITVNSEDLVINTLEIPAGETLTVKIGDGYQATIAKSVAVNGNIVFNALGETASVLVQENVVLDLGETSKITVGANVRMNNYGSINDGTVEVKADGTFYSATPVNTTFTGDGNIDLSDAMETLKISDKLASSAILKPTQNVLVNGNLTINAGEYLVVTGSLEVQEGVTVTINEGGLLMVYGPAASADIQGTIVSKGSYTGEIKDLTNPAGFTYYLGKSIDISGTVTAKKATNDDVRTVWINGDSEISGTVTIDSKAKAEFGGETKIVEGGVLNINGTYAGTILNQGTVNLNGAVDAGAVVSMNSTTAVLNVTALKGTNDLAVNDEGLYLQTDDDGNRIIVGEAADTTVNAITLNNVKGVTVTEGYTYTTDSNGDRIVNNNLYIAGTLNAQDSKDPNVGAMEITSGVLSVTGDLTIAKVNVTIGTDAEMDVTGNVYITNVDDVDFTGTGTLTVTGLVRSADELEANGFTINAVKYEQTIENVPYYFYTSLAAAIASGEENLTVLGDLWILEDTTIPAGITVDASANNVFVGDDSKDITDITLTVANGGLLMAQKIEVDATMMIENTDTGIDCRTIISDVSSTTETTAKYTNIYTALNQAQSGETVTITKSASTDNGIVSVIRDVEIKDGVTLVVPAINQLVISEGVTLTNNGTLDVRGSINAVDENNAAGEFGTETVDEDDNEYAVIANNGTIVSVSKMDYSKYQIAGAYYTINGKFYITPVEDAVAQIGNTETDSITVYGENTVGTVAFVGTVEEPVEVIIAADAEITAESMTVTNGTIVANAGVQLNGTYGGANGAVVMTNMVVSDNATLTVEDKAVTVSEQTSQVTYVYGDVKSYTDDETTTKTVVNAIDFTGDVTVDAALTVDMNKNDDSDSASISGNVTIANTGSNTGAKLEVKGLQLVIEGTVVADNNGTLAGDVAVIGSLSAADKTDKTAAGIIDVGTLMVGAADFKYGTDVAATVNGAFTAKSVYVFSKATLDAAAQKVLADVDSTQFFVEDALWMTAYDIAGVDIALTGQYRVAPTDLTDSEFAGWQYEKDGKLVNVEDSKNVGDFTAVYAAIDYDIYDVVVFADPGISAVYIDGKLMTEGQYWIEATQQWVKGFKLSVAAGTHEITYKLGNYFSGDANMTVNGEAVTGNSFTTSGTDPEDTQVTIYLQGIEASAPETPSTGGSSDDGMGLTDYLLIILVVLIVVMAIMVALRLMRS